MIQKLVNGKDIINILKSCPVLFSTIEQTFPNSLYEEICCVLPS